MKKEFFVFISYARANLETAQDIQEFLEKYHYPAYLLPKDRTVPDECYLRPIFLDVTDLSTTSSSYMEELYDVIRNSQYMLVLCSKESARVDSICHKEIDYFKQIHGADKILPIALDGVDDESIPKELHQIRDERNIVIWNKHAKIKKTSRNQVGIFRIIEFLLGIDGMILNNRYKNWENRRRKKIWTSIFLVLLLIISSLAYAIWETSLVAKSESARANFEKKVFPYSLVYAYANNFLVPLIKHTELLGGEKTIVVIAMPKNYLELENSQTQKKASFKDDVLKNGWILEAAELKIPSRSRPLNTERLLNQGNTTDKYLVYADMVTTVSAIKAVVDYLVSANNSYYSEDQREELTQQYIDEFKNCLLQILESKLKQGSWDIYFVTELESLHQALEQIKNKYLNSL